MKILVDEIPGIYDECIFEGDCNNECALNPNKLCFVAFNEECPYLKVLEQSIKDDCK